jgi:DNA polymerase-3 subunit delta
MIIFFYGKDTYRIKEKIKEIIEEYKKKNTSGFNLRFLNGKDLIFEDLKSELLSISMFKEKKLIVLSDAFSNTKFKEDFIKNGKVFFDSSNIILFYEEGDISLKDKLYVFLKENAKIEIFNPLRSDQLKKWVKKQLKDKKIQEKALEKLIDFVGNDLWRMSKELEKIYNYSKEEIKEEDIEKLVSPVFDNNIFETIDAIAKKEKNRAITLIKHHVENGDSVPYIFSMIAFQFKNIISVKDSKNIYKIGMNPYVLRKSLSQAKNFSIEELKNIYKRIVLLDTDIKTGRISPETALDFLIFDI